jgi:hypothetical protein
MASIADAERAQKVVRKRFGRLPGVRGVGVTWTESGDAHVRINVDRNFRDQVGEVIPPEIDGVKIELRSVSGMRTFASHK